MKFKSTVKFLTVTLAIGAATVTLVNTLQKKRDFSSEQYMKDSNANSINQFKREEVNAEVQGDINNIKESAGIVIAARHEEASEVIREAISNINSTENQSNDRAFDDLLNNLESLSK